MGWAERVRLDRRPAEMFREHAALSAFENDGRRVFDIGALAGLDDGRRTTRCEPVRWPLPRRAGPGRRRAAVRDGRRSRPRTAAPAACRRRTAARRRPDGDCPLLLNTGRMRDQWHTMTRTGRLAAPDGAHSREPLLAIASAMTRRRWACVRAGSPGSRAPHGSVMLRVASAPCAARGEVFAPMHWTDAFASAGPIGRLVGAARRPAFRPARIEGNPRCDSRRCRCDFQALLSAQSPPCRQGRAGLPLDRASRSPPGTLYRLAGLRPMPEGEQLDRLASRTSSPCRRTRNGWRSPIRGAACCASRRSPTGSWKPASFLARDGPPAATGSGRTLLGAPVPDACGSGCSPALPPAGTAEEGAAGLRLLRRRRRHAVRRAIVTHRLRTIAEIGTALRAGTNCGSCVSRTRGDPSRCPRASLLDPVEPHARLRTEPRRAGDVDRRGAGRSGTADVARRAGTQDRGCVME